VADAEIIQFGPQGPASHGSSSRSKPAEQADAAGAGQDPPAEPVTGAPPTLDLGALLTELVRTAASGLEVLKSVPVERINEIASDPLRAAMSVAETLGVDWQPTLDEAVAFARSRLTGDYAVDEFGFDPEFTTKIFLPLLRPLVQSWFRVEVRGAENLPARGSALLVSNHAGTLPIDGMVLHSVVYDEIGRHVRMLGADLIFKTPYSHDLARRTGVTLACCWPMINWSRSSLRVSRDWASRTPTATSCSGSAEEASSQPPYGRRCRSSLSRSSAPRRSTP